MVVMVKMIGNALRLSARYTSCYSDWVRNKELAVSLWCDKMVKRLNKKRRIVP